MSCRARPTSWVDLTPLRSRRRRLATALLTRALPATWDRRVGFYGSLEGDKWVPGEEVIAEAYDVPIPG